jgi:citronellol/citronellal dehydrogenase
MMAEEKEKRVKVPTGPAVPGPRNVFVADLLAGRCALVTGGGTGIGRAIAQGLAAAGADLLLAARRNEPLEIAAEEIRKETGRRVEVANVNIRDRESIEALAIRAVDLFGQVDVLVNNAGGQFPQPVRDYKPKGWNAVIDTNLNGTFHMTQIFGNQMLDGHGGTITQIVANVGRGMPGLGHTAAARAGVIELTRTLAYEWGPRVRLNCVAPGPIATKGFDDAYDVDFQAEGGLSGLPLPRFGYPHEVAHAVTFLASPAASWITGEVLYVAGGQQNYGRNQAVLDESFGRPGKSED